MKKLLLSTVALVGLSAVASAADLPRRTAPVVYAPVPIFTWTGFYIGANAGYGFGDSNTNELFVPPGTIIGAPALTGGTITFGDRESEGFIGGGQLGYNFQFTPGSGFVIGVEADLQYADLSRNNDNNFGLGIGFGTFTPPGGFPAGFVPTDTSTNGIEWFGTVRARLGYAFDRTLVYATGGFAYGGGNDNNNNNLLGFTSNNDDTRTGWVVGGGVEFALPTSLFGPTTAVTFKIEGLYVSLENDNNSQGLIGFTPAGPVFSTVSSKNDDTEFGVVRAGINVKF